MAGNPGEPTRRTQRRDQRRDQRREWSALDTPSGFERCVRATLRELYGYVALLSGRDRRGAERVVGDVYRSLFLAAGNGYVDSVTLGALRSAARRTWLEEHRVELAATDEVSRAPVSTIAELSSLERAVLVLRHVNAMSTDRAATELGRSEREIAALDVHVVRRLRGTDDASGTWLRAYLGPSVSPAAGLVDRIVERLAAPEPDTTGRPTDASDEPTATESDQQFAPIEPVDDGDGVDGGADGGVDDGVDDGVDAGAGGELRVDATETTELAIVERPTVEVPTVAAHDTPEPLDVSTPVRRVEPEPDIRRPRWALAIGAVLVAGLVAALVWLALRGDPADTVGSTPETSADAEAGPADDGGGGQARR